MAIKCGNCGNYHDNVQQVMNCHNAVQTMSPATEKQRSFISKLLNERVTTEEFKGFASGDLSKIDASKVIGHLLQLPMKPQQPDPKWVADIVGEIPDDGTYTIVLVDDSHRTIRIRKPHPKANHRIAEYLYGPDNSLHFKKFARETTDGFRFLPGITEHKLKVALRGLMDADNAELHSMGFEYALKSKRCWRCGKKLTVPTSIHRGLGPDCAGKVDV